MEKKSDWKQAIADREKRRAEANELLEKGWKSSVDVAYKIAHEMGDKHTALITQRIAVDVAKVAETEGAEYTSNNLKKIFSNRLGTTFVSPDFAAKLSQLIHDRYKNWHDHRGEGR